MGDRFRSLDSASLFSGATEAWLVDALTQPGSTASSKACFAAAGDFGAMSLGGSVAGLSGSADQPRRAVSGRAILIGMFVRVDHDARPRFHCACDRLLAEVKKIVNSSVEHGLKVRSGHHAGWDVQRWYRDSTSALGLTC